MRFPNSNKAAISNLAKKCLKANRLRNTFAVAAIALTTVLFTSLFTIGIGMVESVEQQTMRKAGGYAHASFKYLTKEELDNIKEHPLVKELGYSIMPGMGENKEVLKRHTKICHRY